MTQATSRQALKAPALSHPLATGLGFVLARFREALMHAACVGHLCGPLEYKQMLLSWAPPRKGNVGRRRRAAAQAGDIVLDHRECWERHTTGLLLGML